MLTGLGRAEETWDVLARPHYDPKDTVQTFAREEFYQITTQIATDRAAYGEVTWLDMFKKPHFRKRLLCSGIVMFTSQAGGNLVIYSNISILTKGLGFDSGASLFMSAAYITWACVCNFANATFLDRLSRIKLMLIGFSAGGIFVAIEAALVAEYGSTTNHASLATGVATLFCYITTFAGFCNTTLRILLRDLPDPHPCQHGLVHRNIHVVHYPLHQVFYLWFSSIGWKYYMVFVALPVVCVAAMADWCLETKGLSLEAINGLFGDEVAINITHLTSEQKEALDETIGGAANKRLGEKESTPKKGTSIIEGV
ncbi:hypothetical protein B0J14DRAFT_555215 [Halenospora varia]|nr:hypothetical protein B0J14DRAFT_555215 [Halenospora varia]